MTQVMYGVVIAHSEGKGTERVLMRTITPSLAVAEGLADAWTRKHGHRAHGTDRCGWYAYGDRVTGARAPMRGSMIRIPSGR